MYKHFLIVKCMYEHFLSSKHAYVYNLDVSFSSNRKAKLIFFYEWDIKLKWKAVNDEEDYDVEGKIEIPNLSEENDIDEVDVSDPSCCSET